MKQSGILWNFRPNNYFYEFLYKVLEIFKNSLINFFIREIRKEFSKN